MGPAPLHLPDLKANLSAWQEGLAETGWGSLYWDNHDQPRIVSRWGDDGEHRVASAKTLASVLHLLRGTPYVYQGEELGMTNAHLTSLDGYRDIESLSWAREAMARGVARPTCSARSRPSRATTPGPRCSGTPDRRPGSRPGRRGCGQPQRAEINAEAAVADPGSVFHHYRRLIEARHTLPVVVDGAYRLLLPADEQVFAYVRSLGATTLLLVANVSGAPRRRWTSARTPGCWTARCCWPRTTGRPSGRGPVTLAPWESFAVLRG